MVWWFYTEYMKHEYSIEIYLSEGFIYVSINWIMIGSCNVLLPVSCQATSWANTIPDSKVHGANMGPIWGRQDPGGPHFGPMNLALWDVLQIISWKQKSPTSVQLEWHYDNYHSKNTLEYINKYRTLNIFQTSRSLFSLGRITDKYYSLSKECQLPSDNGPVLHASISYNTALTGAEYISEFKPTKDTPYLT